MIHIDHYTDPACPFAFSAEPARLRLSWLYGDALQWHTRMVGLSEDPAEYTDKGLTPERQAHSFEKLARLHGMPIDSAQRPRMIATVPACRAVVAARVHAPESEERLLRRLRVLTMSGELIDEPDVIERAAEEVGLDRARLPEWLADAAVQRVLTEDLDDARRPTPAALGLDHKLAAAGDGRRYTCPSYELRAEGGQSLTAPGFQPVAVYEAAVANLEPDLARREDPESVTDVLGWAPYPLATEEVAAISDRPREEVREELARRADLQPVGLDGYWSLTRSS